MDDVLAPGPAATAGAPHGQRAGRLSNGGLALAAAKTIEEDTRAQLLLVPGLIRIDVVLRGENLTVVPRNLSSWDVRYTTDEATARGYLNADADPSVAKKSGLFSTELWAGFDYPGDPLFFVAVITSVGDADLPVSHFLAKGEAWLHSMGPPVHER